MGNIKHMDILSFGVFQYNIWELCIIKAQNVVFFASFINPWYP